MCFHSMKLHATEQNNIVMSVFWDKETEFVLHVSAE